MIELLGYVSYLITLYTIIIVASVVMSWLIGLGTLNQRNPMVRSVYDLLLAVTEPLLRPIRRVLPDLGAIDISPMVLLLGCQFIQGVLIPNLARAIH